MKVPYKLDPIGYQRENGMWLENGILGGRLCNTRNNTKLIGVSSNADFSLIENGRQMFYECTSPKEWNANLPNLLNGTNMFTACRGLKKWNGLMPKISNGTYMFYLCRSLAETNGEMPNL